MIFVHKIPTDFRAILLGQCQCADCQADASSALTNDLADAQETIDTLQKSVQNYACIVTNQVASIDNHKMHIDALESRIRGYDADVKGMALNATQLRSKIEEQAETIATLTRELEAEQSTELADARRVIHYQRETIAALKKSIETQRRTIAELRSIGGIGDWMDRVEEQKDRIRDLEAKVEAAKIALA